MSNCVFCAKFDPMEPGDIISFTPLSPVVPGHVLFIHRVHTTDAGESPQITADLMKAASQYANELEACNIITSKGEVATQSVFHLHIHVIPRMAGDDLTLPWSNQGSPAQVGAHSALPTSSGSKTASRSPKGQKEKL